VGIFHLNFWFTVHLQIHFTYNEGPKMDGGVVHCNIAQMKLEKFNKNPKNIRSPYGL